MNEPHRGYVELYSMHAFDYNTDLHLGHVRKCDHRAGFRSLADTVFIATAFQSFMLGAGYPTAVGFWTRSFPFPTRRTSTKVLNTARQKAWRDDGPTKGQCLWEMHGVWDWDRRKDEGVVLRESYFTKDPMTGRKVDWYEDFFYPFVQQWAEAVRGVTGSDKLVFVEPIPNEVSRVFCSCFTASHILTAVLSCILDP